jgi:tape measure domain-containing protein
MAVEIKVVANTKQAERSMDKLEKKVSGVGKGADKTSGSFDKVSKSVKKVERGSDLSKLTKNTERAADSAESLEKSFSDATRTINKLVIASTALLTTYITVKGVVTGVADQYRRINSQLRLVTRSTQQIVVANERLFKISQDTRSSFEATTNLFTRFARVSKDLGATQNQVLAVTKTVQQAIKISGTSAQSAEAAIVQLGQGLASGTLRGEELNSVLEQAPRLASAIADGIGVSVGQLRKLGAEGKITSSEVFDALLSQSKQIAGEFAQIETTFSGASQVAGNAFARFVNELDKASGFSQALIDTTLDIGRAFEKVATRVEFNVIRIRNLFNELAFQSRLVFASVAETFNDSEIGKQVTRAFQSLQSIDLSGIKLPTIKLDSIVSGFDVAINAIDKFYKLVSGYFYDLYMDVIGNSTYTDLINGVTEKSQSLITNVVPKIRSFATSVSSIFKGIEQPDLAGVTPEALAALNSNVSISSAGGGDLPLAIRALDASLGILNTTLKFVSQGLRDFREAFGNNAMAGLIAGIALLNKNFRSQLTGGTGARAGGFIAGNVEATLLSRFTTKLSGDVAALERIAGRSSGRVSEVNSALTNLAERVGQTARDTISRFNDEIRETGMVTAATEQEMRDLAQSLNGSARAAILAEIEFRKSGLTQEQAARRAGGATARLVAEEQRLKAIRDAQAKATGRVRESFVSGGQQLGGALGATGGFLAGQQFIDYLEKNVGELSGWQEAGITIAASFGGQALGSALGAGAGAAAGFAFGGLIAKGIAAAGAAIAAIGGGIAVAFRASTAAFAAVGAAIGVAFRGSLVFTGISSIIGTALASAFAIAVAGISLPALAIGALVVGGVSLAYYFRDAIVEAFKIAKTKVTDFFTGIFGDSSEKSQVNGGARRRASRNMATGGKVSGAGTGTSDSIPANLSNGEFVVNAAATKKHAGLLARLNGGMNPGGDGKGGYAGGGLVGDETAVLKHLRKFEGYVPHIYTDTEGFATIGIGHLLTDSDISSGRFFDPKDPLTEEYKKMSKKDLGKLFHANGLGSQYRKPSVQLNDGEANSMALADYGRNLGHLLSKDVFREAYAKAPFYAQGVLGDLAFNLGANLDNSFPGFTRGMAAGDYPHAAGQLRDSRYYYQTGRRAIANVNQLGQGEVDPVGIKRQSRVSNLFGYALNSGYSKNLMKAIALDENQGGLFQASNPGNLISDVLAESLSGSSRLALETAGYMKPKTKENKENKEAKPEEQGFFSRLGSFFADTNRMMMPMGFATGGSVNGPGTGTSDSIPARLSNGEFVVNAKATQQNRALLEQINSGAVMGFKDGGPVGGRQQRVLGGLNRQGFDTTNMEKINDQQLTQLVDFSRILSSVNDRIEAQRENNMDVAKADYELQERIEEKIGGILNANDKTIEKDKDLGFFGRAKKGFDKGEESGESDFLKTLTGDKGEETKFSDLGNNLGSALGESFGSSVKNSDPFSFLADGLAQQAEYSEGAFEMQKKLQIAQATMNGFSAAVGAYQALAPIPFVGPVLGAAAAAAAISFTGTQVGQIRSQQFQKPSFATGGYVSGAGTGTSDSISANLSNGEYVINARQTSRNRELLESINRGNGSMGAGDYVQQQVVEVNVGLGRNSQATADAASSNVLNVLERGRRDAPARRRRVR